MSILEMHLSLWAALSIVLAYLLGSIPTSVWLGKWFYGIDIREWGSGNAGTTNTLRVLGKGPAAFVFFVDAAKGFIASCLPIWFKLSKNDYVTENWQILAGVAAVVGHVFPIFAQFKGGKGVATLLGVSLALQLHAALACFGVFLIVLFSSGFVSLGSITAALFFPCYVLLIDQNNHLLTIIFAIAIPTLILITHTNNIKRLVRHSESKLHFKQPWGLRKNRRE